MRMTNNMQKILEVLANSTSALSLDQIAHRAQLETNTTNTTLETLTHEGILTGEQTTVAEISTVLYMTTPKAQRLRERYQSLRHGAVQTLSYDIHLDGALDLILFSFQYDQEQGRLNNETIASTFLGLLGQLACSSQITPPAAGTLPSDLPPACQERQTNHPHKIDG